MDAQTRYNQITQWIKTAIAEGMARGQGFPEINAFFQQELADTKTTLRAQGLDESAVRNRSMGG